MRRLQNPNDPMAIAIATVVFFLFVFGFCFVVFRDDLNRRGQDLPKSHARSLAGPRLDVQAHELGKRPFAVIDMVIAIPTIAIAKQDLGQNNGIVSVATCRVDDAVGVWSDYGGPQGVCQGHVVEGWMGPVGC